MAMGSKALESPLISHARMRAMYRALVETRLLLKQARVRPLRGAEACCVGAAIDLREGDLTSDAGKPHEQALIAHIRAVGQRPDGGKVTAAELRRLLTRMRGAAPDAFPGSPANRLLCAVGAAMALRAAGSERLVLAYVEAGAMKAGEWRRVLPAMAQAGLPLIVAVLPAAPPETRPALDLEALALRVADKPEKAIPVIPVDAGDVVAIYRVAQESAVRARAGGGAAVLLGVDCGTDPIALLGSQLVRKGICTQHWIDGVQPRLQAVLDRPKTAPRGLH
jgi:TPP-dependent pyruvate/acetoin dehydrogenase alpha subunit